MNLNFKNQSYDDFKFINEEYAWVSENNMVVETAPIGSFFAGLTIFNVARLPKVDLQKYLSLFYSYVENAKLQYEDYTVKRVPDPLKAKPALIFEKVDADNSLYMRVGQIMPNTEIDFLDEYDLFRFASVNEMEENINVHPIEQLH